MTKSLTDRQRHDLDNYITGHYGEDQFKDDTHENDWPEPPEETVDGPQPRCTNCGAPGQFQIPYRDVSSTDRGDEIREGYEWVCGDEDCLPAGYKRTGE